MGLRRKGLPGLLPVLFLLAAGCKGGEEDQARSPQARAAAKLFVGRCGGCHGPQGAGDGPVSAGMQPRPRSFLDPAWQSSVDDAYLAQIIVRGGASVGRSAAMPAFPDLAGQPMLDDLIAHLRWLGAQGQSR